ncbi:Fic family protein [Mammaliicoccus sciuri]|uniref:Fic family protein n=1 Tax=Mammaliicoccus sciuri TaxID=1296 RepID=UPI001FB2805D|nr:Fic family protein [Mammaliicoccus sciuri]MCJ1777675.1 Fic family protein [Mammaliicoccus sciuri]
MKLTCNQINLLKQLKNGVYDRLKTDFLFHSNKMEGSTFSKIQLAHVLHEREVFGNHKLDDIIQTTNSLELFDYVVHTADEPLSERIIREYHGILMYGSQNVFDKALAGKYRPTSAELKEVDLKLSDQFLIQEDMESLINRYNGEEKDIDSITKFYIDFEKIHPFHDGNGRIGRFIILKECIKEHLDLIAIDSEFANEYKSALYQSQIANEVEDLKNVFTKCQNRLSSKLEKYQETFDYIKKFEHELETMETNKVINYIHNQITGFTDM